MKSSIDVIFFVGSARAETTGHFYYHREIDIRKFMGFSRFLPDLIESKIIYSLRSQFLPFNRGLEDIQDHIHDIIKSPPKKSSWWKNWKNTLRKKLSSF